MDLRKQARKKRIMKGLLYGSITLYALFCIMPFVLLIIVSFTPQEIISEQGYTFFPKKMTLDAYKYVFRFPEMIIKAYGVSLFVAIVGTVLNLAITMLIAYPLSRRRFRYRRIISFLVFFTMMFGGGMIPSYIVTKRWLGLGDNIWVMILPSIAAPMNVFLMRVFMQAIPEELYESAVLDGADEFTIFTKMVTPLVKPGMVAVLMFILLAYWNDAFTAKLYISDTDLYPLQLVMANYMDFIDSITNSAIDAGMMQPGKVPGDAVMFAMSIVATGPMLFVFLGFQKYFVSGMTMGAIKN